MGVHYTGGSVVSPIDLDWGELGNRGTASEVGRYLENHDGTCDYENMNNATDIDAYNVFAMTTLFGKQGREQRLFKQFRGKMQGGNGEWFPENISDFREKGGIHRNFEESKAPFARA